MSWDGKSGVTPRSRGAGFHRVAGFFPIFPLLAAALIGLGSSAVPAAAREKDTAQYGAGLIVNIPLPEPEVAQVVQDVAQNTFIRGTKEYNKDEYVAGAVEAKSTPVFPAWSEGGKVFYKVRAHALDPLNFKNSGDLGTLAVRYVVQPQGERNTVLRIDAVFVEDYRRGTHPSNGSVESSEYKDIQERLAAVELMKKEDAEAEQAKQERMAQQKFGMGTAKDQVLLSTPPGVSSSRDGSEAASRSYGSVAASDASGTAEAYDSSSETLEQHVASLRRQVERIVKRPGAALQSSPFHSATTLKTLEPGTEVLILISTPYWYGVETRDGDHGWLRRDQLELAP